MTKFEKHTMPYVVVFIPAYNEQDGIADVIKGIQEQYQGEYTKDYILDIIVINGASTDRTVEIAKEKGVKQIIHEPIKKGLGAATRIGMMAALEIGADIAVKIDADGQNPPSEIEKVVRPILEEKADCVFGSRLMGGLRYKMPFYRDFGNKFFAWLISKIIGMKWTDATTGLMAFNKRYLGIFNIIKDYNETQQLILDSWGKHMRIMEVSTIFLKRRGGKSFIKASFKYPSIVLPTIFRMYIHYKPLRFFLTIGLLFILLGLWGGIYLLMGGDAFFGDTTIAILIVVGVQIIIFGLLADQISFKRK